MALLKKIANNSAKSSLSHTMRYKRFNYFIKLLDKLDKPVSILDIGGTQQYWENMGMDDPKIKVALLNLTEQPITLPNFSSVVGDATNLEDYADRSFDIVFSNSVIEHLFTKENQVLMAKEVIRVGKYHFVQTPNYYFPIEPHFLFPGFQFLPKSTRISLINKFNLGHISRKENIYDARMIVEEIRLLKIKEMQELFPNSIIWREKIVGLVKSIVAHNLC